MIKRWTLLLCTWLPLGAALAQPDSVLRVMERVAGWQLAQWKDKGMKYPPTDWVNAVGYTGYVALGRLSRDTTYTAPLYRIGSALHWQTGPRRTLADDYCIGQTYVQLSLLLRQPELLGPFRTLADSMIRLSHDESLEWKSDVALREWAWCDALFMGPAGLALLSEATRDRRYLDLADTLWWKTTAYLFDTAQCLYYRDSRFFGEREANGQPVFWARGNGWVLAGLVRMLDHMPSDYPDRPRFLRLYRAMATRIAALQRPDGTWHASLLDPGSFPGKETSGTGLYCYALAWGINHRLLSARGFSPVVARAWSALLASIQPDGRLGYVQQIGEKPAATNAYSTEAYGTGAFLLAGSEVYTLYKDRRIVR